MEQLKKSGTFGYWIGFWILVGCWVISFLMSGLVEPLPMLLFRLTLNGIAVLYFLFYYLFQTLHQYRLARRRRTQIIVLFNGKESILEG
ncbi:hypothetical protein [Sutcliffiella horikoshii]|uniref:hypothetical protein n=1 Tax=Sutcliffiella horikoshii TaxID=79883 RepID=UPI001F46BDEB|nr:hypothetical protein [Sutcliffiella horikoshii]MCG1023492.1 hypothetical protein [Sutcliffiella horikoshii]